MIVRVQMAASSRKSYKSTNRGEGSYYIGSLREDNQSALEREAIGQFNFLILNNHYYTYSNVTKDYSNVTWYQCPQNTSNAFGKQPTRGYVNVMYSLSVRSTVLHLFINHYILVLYCLLYLRVYECTSTTMLELE